MAKKKTENSSCRLGRVGGQAVLEGVMMKAGPHTVTTCRKEDKTLVVNDDNFVSVRKKHKILNIPILRGVINFVEMMILSVKTLNASADALGIEEEDGKAEKWMRKHLGIGLTDLIMVLGIVLGIGLAVVLFILLPTLAADGINYLYKLISGNEAGINASLIAVIEGVTKIIIFLAYLALVALMSDIKRTFMYHGAEHKSIACFEAGDELTPENARRHRRFHPRCGTSFMFLMILLGIFAGMFVRNVFPGLHTLAYAGIKLLILPVIMGVGYEMLMIMGKHDNVLTRILSAPGIWVQRLTTKEPTDDMLEVAIVSLKCALRDEFPEFMEYFNERPWEAEGGETIIGSVKEDEKCKYCAHKNECAVRAAKRAGKETDASCSVNALTDAEVKDADTSTEAAAGNASDGALTDNTSTEAKDDAFTETHEASKPDEA